MFGRITLSSKNKKGKGMPKNVTRDVIIYSPNGKYVAVTLNCFQHLKGVPKSWKFAKSLSQVPHGSKKVDISETRIRLVSVE